MRERIMRLSRGIVDAETPKLFLEPAKVEETLGSDTVYKENYTWQARIICISKVLPTQATAV